MAGSPSEEPAETNIYIINFKLMDKDKKLKEIRNALDDILEKCQSPKNRYLTQDWVNETSSTVEYWNNNSVAKLSETCSDLSEFEFKLIESEVKEIEREYAQKFQFKLQRVTPTKTKSH
jgi:hypothetical protein